jgi:hypothetical protein
MTGGHFDIPPDGPCPDGFRGPGALSRVAIALLTLSSALLGGARWGATGSIFVSAAPALRAFGLHGGRSGSGRLGSRRGWPDGD